MPGTKTELQKRDILRLSAQESNKITRECLQTALLILLENKPMEKITITELVERSGVSRSAFYRNYNTKEDILVDIRDTIINNMKIAVKEFSTVDKYKYFVQLFQLLKENATNIPLLFRTDFLKLLFEKESLLDMIFIDASIKDHYHSIALVGALTHIMFYWIKDGMKESVEEISKICYDFCNELKLN